MLKVFRDNLKYLSWVLWIVIAVFILFVFVDFGASIPRGTITSDAAASVGSYEVSYGDFERSYRQAEQFYRQLYGEQFDRQMAQQMGLPLQVLDRLIADRVMLAEAKRMGLRATNEEVQQTILDFPAFQRPEGGFVGEETYRQILRSSGYTVGDFEETIRAQVLTEKARDVLSQNLFVADGEVADAYREQVERASIRFVSLDSFGLADEITLTPEEVEAYFASHQEDFRVPERRQVDYLLVDPAELRATIEISEDELNDYYDEHVDEFTQEEEVRARHILLQINSSRNEEQAEEQMVAIRSRIEGGEDFAELAAELSDDPGSKAQGGDLGFFGRGQMITEFEEAAFAAEPGDLVGPIRTSFGYHLIEVLEKRQGGQQSFQDAQEVIRELLLTERARDLAETRARELAERIRKEDLGSPEMLQGIADTETGVTFHTPPPFSREDNVPGIGRATLFSVSTFDLQLGEVSDPVRAGAGWTIVHLKEIQEPHISELEDVGASVEAALRAERQLDIAKQRMAAARLELDTGKGLDEVASQLGVAVQESGEFGSTGPVGGLGANDEIVEAALALDEGQFGGPVVHDQQVVLFEVISRQRFDPEVFEQQKQRTREEIRAQRLEELLTSLINRRREEMGVRYDTRLLANFELPGGEPRI
jgi:peptidyl-prolyl cis-trans isomerase D